MEFQKFNSIENHYREKTIDQIRLAGFEGLGYIITEKIHGANFSFWYDGNAECEVKIASRTQFVDTTFYSCGEVFERYSRFVVYLYNYMRVKGTLTVYGELYGPGVQKGINYGGAKDFVAFDVAVNGVALPPREARIVLSVAEIPYVPVIGEANSLSEALQFGNVFNSKLGEAKGVAGENVAEGFVIQPYDVVCYLNSGSRVILKSKNEKWSEKAKAPKEKVEVKDDPLVPVITQYVTENRVNAVTSKLGELTPRDFGTVIKAMCEDVIEDMVKDGDVPEDWRSQEELKNLGKSVNKVVVPFLKKELLPKL